MGFPGGAVKNPACPCKRRRVRSLGGKITWRRKWQPVFLSGKLHGQKSSGDYSLRGGEELDTAE